MCGNDHPIQQRQGMFILWAAFLQIRPYRTALTGGVCRFVVGLSVDGRWHGTVPLTALLLLSMCT
jgi:hypothetical protein